MVSRFFIQRPIFACVISILITLGGLVALFSLPIEQYPNMTPPQVQITLNYPGASAQIVADTVAAPLENQINGVENMIYMYSESSATGNLTLNVFFKIGTDINQALNNVQIRVDQALSQLPEEAQRIGVVVKKQTPTILLLVALQSPDERYDEIYVSNYASIYLADALQRLNGISNAQVINARDYSMRIWLRPDKMAQLGIATSDVIQSIQHQNEGYPIGELGMPPTQVALPLTLPVVGLGRLDEPLAYENIILRATPDGASVLIKDVGKVVLGAQDYTVDGALDGKPAALIAVYQEYGANALNVANAVKATVSQLAKRFPSGLAYSIPYDTTTFIEASIHEVKQTLYIAAFLVALVVLIFLQSSRATLIPVIAMIVSIIGTFIGLHLLGFSLNTLTLFGLVLAIGIVVDDAIVVVENVERNIREKGIPPKEAALAAMNEVSGPIIAIVFVLCAVFLPVAFLGGIAGELYKQFALTISISVIFSGIVALTLSPVLAVFLFKPHEKTSWLSGKFNSLLDYCTSGYLRGISWLIDKTWTGMLVFAGILVLIFLMFRTTPSSLVPQEDQGYLFAFANLPEGASLSRTKEVTDALVPMVMGDHNVKHFVSLSGFSLMENLNRTTVGTYFIILKNWEDRKAKAAHAAHILRQLGEAFSQIPQGLVLPFNPPAIQGLGTVGGFEFWITNEGGSQDDLEQAVDKFLEKGKKSPELARLTSAFQSNCMHIFADLNRTKARALKVPVGEVYQTLQSLLGSVYVNNFNQYGHVFKVMVQAEPAFRNTLEEIGNIYVRSETNQMVPIKSLVTFRHAKGFNLVSRFNNSPSAKINGSAADGYSSGQAINAMEKIAEEILPPEMSFSWSGEAYQEKVTGGTSNIVITAALVLVFLILAALYERWSLPLAILLGVPFGIFGALVAIWLRGLENDIYFQIGLVTLIALAAKNAILIVEFATQRRQEGLSVRMAALEAARQRFRAIVMTSLTFIFGVLPLVLSSGAGAASRHSVGTGVMGGMIFATLLGVFYIPFFYKLFDRKKLNK